MTFDPESDSELLADIELDAVAEKARERVVGGLLRIVLVAPAIVLATLPVAILFKSISIMVMGVVGGFSMAIRGITMTVNGRRELRSARERRQLPVATLRPRS